MRHLFVLLLASWIAAASLADPPGGRVAVSRPLGTDEIRRKLGLLPEYAAEPRLADVKVAILDSGFAGVSEKRPYLPADAILVEHYDPGFVRKFGLGDPAFRRPFVPGETHGRLMAQLVWAMCGNDPRGPRFFLLNANGPTMFRRAVRLAIERKVDVLLFSGNFEGAGNYDGGGPINAAVDEAVQAGIIWVNAAGNTGGRVFNGPVEVGDDGFIRFPRTPLNTALRFTNRFDENTVTITLTWNDYRQAEDAGTEKDLDLIVEDASGRTLGSGRLKQIPAERPTGRGETKNPRERLVLDNLAAVRDGQEYRIRVKAMSNNFGPRDRLRILVSSARTAPFVDPESGKATLPVEFLDASRSSEIYPPADHFGVLTVGDRSPYSSSGPTADGRTKPDVLLEESAARFSNGEETVGSSNAAAYFAGVAALLRAREPALGAVHLRAWSRRLELVQASNLPRRASPEEAANPEASPLPQPNADQRPRGVTLTPNQRRALRFAEGSMIDNRRQKGLAPYIVMSSSGGTYLIQPGGKLLAGDAPPHISRPVVEVRPPTKAIRPAPQPFPAFPQPIVRAAAPAEGRPAAKKPSHAAWATPSPRELKKLLRDIP